MKALLLFAAIIVGQMSTAFAEELPVAQAPCFEESDVITELRNLIQSQSTYGAELEPQLATKMTNEEWDIRIKLLVPQRTVFDRNIKLLPSECPNARELIVTLVESYLREYPNREAARPAPAREKRRPITTESVTAKPSYFASGVGIGFAGNVGWALYDTAELNIALRKHFDNHFGTALYGSYWGTRGGFDANLGVGMFISSYTNRWFRAYGNLTFLYNNNNIGTKYNKQNLSVGIGPGVEFRIGNIGLNIEIPISATWGDYDSSDSDYYDDESTASSSQKKSAWMLQGVMPIVYTGITFYF